MGGKGTLRRRGGRGTFALMDRGEEHRGQARRAAERAQGLLAQPATLDTYAWGLVASLLIEADDALKRAQQLDEAVTLPLLAEVLNELQDVTANFTSPAFLRATRPARRQNPTLFAPRR